jgi:uncharacterized protein (DUF2267 family)
VDYEQFLTMVEQQTELDREAAERATRAVLETLAERLSPGEARDLRDQLPAELKPSMYDENPIDPFDVDEFLRRVASREGVDIATAEKHARAVLYVLGRAISSDEIADMAADLPQDFAPLVAEATGERIDVMPADEFVRRVVQRTGLDVERARKATEAVLETLAERIAGGEVEDLIAHLPIEFHEALKRGNALSDGAARKMSLDKFLELIAEREGVTPDKAYEHARAVFATLREALTEKQFSDVTVQLRADYSELLAWPQHT